ncbi:MAG: hypothetical protein JNL07_09350 [Rhodospirillales bacterium]|nr:hypothetical protein [Rhodospirillales bacterium]
MPDRPFLACLLAPALLAAAVTWSLPGAASAQRTVQTLQSRPGPGEVDTANRPGGQAGGRRLGVNYELSALRCPAGDAIVGVGIRRGNVLDRVQIACATPVCDANGCRWTASRPGAAAGGGGGDAHPAMTCAQDEMVSGVRARVVRFTQFDYAADLAIECSRITGRGARSFFRVAREEGRWHHPEGGFGRTRLPANVVEEGLATIACRATGGVSAISVAVADTFVLPRQRVVQALSLYCPDAGGDPSCPDSLVVSGATAHDDIVDRQWFARGGRTGGGLVSTMEARPAARNWSGARIVETVRLDAASNTCAIPNAAALCGTGGHRNFTVGGQGNSIRLPIGNIEMPWNVPAGGQARNSFPDSHFVFDVGPGNQPAGRDALGALPGVTGPCTVACVQTYACGAGAQQVTYGPFRITYTFRRDTFQPTLPGLIPLPTGGRTDITRVDAVKR